MIDRGGPFSLPKKKTGENKKERIKKRDEEGGIKKREKKEKMKRGDNHGK